MRKLLIATTALTLAGSAAFAELSMSGTGELGIDYDSEAAVKHTFVHQADINFAGSGTTDGGLSFGGAVGFNTGADTIDTGTVYISGGFGTLTIGDNDAADLAAGGIADVGMNAIGVDDAGESLRGGTAAQLRYDQSFGAASIAVSAGNKAEAADDNPYAVGLSFTAGDIRIGVGYDSSEVVSLGVGYSVANISVNGFYSSHSERAGDSFNDVEPKAAVAKIPGYTDDNDNKVAEVPSELEVVAVAGPAYTSKANTIGADLTYTLGATALTIAYGKLDVKAASVAFVDDNNTADLTTDDATTTYNVGGSNLTSIGVGITHDLGGGASVSAGFGKVEKFGVVEAALGVPVLGTDKDKKPTGDFTRAVTRAVTSQNKASIGITLKF